MFKQYSTKLKAYFSNNSQDAVEIEARRRINEEKMRNAEIKRMIEFEGAVVETMSMMRADPSFKTRDEIEKEEKERKIAEQDAEYLRKCADSKKATEIEIAETNTRIEIQRLNERKQCIRGFLAGFDKDYLGFGVKDLENARWQLNCLLSILKRNKEIEDYANDIAIKFGYPDGFPTNLTIMENHVWTRVNAT